MTKQEKDRSLLRAFGDAARYIMAHPRPNRVACEYDDNAFTGSESPWSPRQVTRRGRAYSAAYAHALATA